MSKSRNKREKTVKIKKTTTVNPILTVIILNVNTLTLAAKLRLEETSFCCIFKQKPFYVQN